MKDKAYKKIKSRARCHENIDGWKRMRTAAKANGNWKTQRNVKTVVHGKEIVITIVRKLQKNA